MFGAVDARLTHDPDARAVIFHDLPNEAAHGVVCVVCGADFFLSGIHAQPVGSSATTGQTVHACPPCVAASREVAEAGEQLELTPSACPPAG